MKTKSLLLMCVAVGCGLVSMLGVKQFMNKNQTQEAETVDVLIATMAIQQGDPLDETNTEFKAYPIDSLAEGVVTDREQVVERALKASAYPGDFILEQKLTNKGDIGFVGLIPAGMRAVTLKVDATTSHSGMVRPGHHVDVMCTYKIRSREGMKSETRTVLQFIKVLATDNTREAGNADTQQSSSKNITLLVTPQEATKFLQAKDMSNNNLHLALRANSDTEDTDSADLDDSWLIGSKDDEEEAPVEVATEPTAPVDIASQLQDELNGPEQFVMVDEVSKPVPGSWKIEIFEGENRRIETVEMPIEESEEDSGVQDSISLLDIPKEEPADEQAASPLPPLETEFEVDSSESDVEESDESITEPAREAAANGLKGLLSKYFTGA